MKNIKTKLFILGLITVQTFCMVQGFLTTSDHSEYRIGQGHAQTLITDDSVKPQTTKEAYAKQIVTERVMLYFGKEYVPFVFEILSHEGGFKPEAQNPTSTAYGMFQFLDSTWKTVGCVKTSDITEQSECAMDYIKSRYGDPAEALKFRLKNGWY